MILLSRFKLTCHSKQCAGYIFQNVVKVRTHAETSRYASTSDGKKKVMAIKREDESIWERRAPFSPNHVRSLVKKKVKVLIQPSNRRAYPSQAYWNAGATIEEDISEATVIFGIKQVPVDQLVPDKTYCFFSHTIKAQESSMPLLDAILEKRIRLIDYETMINEKGRRVVVFGRMAGMSGMISILHGLGLRYLALGHHTPFIHIAPPHNYMNSCIAKQAIRDAGYEIALGLMPESIGPLTFVFTGSGNVSQGAQEMFRELPHEFVPPEELRKASEHGQLNKIYGCVIRRFHYLERMKGGGYDQKEYSEHPDLYRSTFSEKFAPYTSVLINGIYWPVNSPRLITIKDAKRLLRPKASSVPVQTGVLALTHKLLAICDISADPGGSIEFMKKCTTIDSPFVLYDAQKNKEEKTYSGPGILICSIDNMPTQLPRESTDFFGDLLYPHVLNILQSDGKLPLEKHNFNSLVQGAIIASNGMLTPNYQYIQDLRHERERKRHQAEASRQKKKNLLILGAGHVAPPLVQYLHRRHKDINITLACEKKELADRIAKKFPGVESTYLDASKESNLLQEVITKSDVVISILPPAFHYIVAKACIKGKTHMVTASYISEKMKKFHDDAVKAGVTILFEVGLDPGIDHLLALECIQEVQKQGGKVVSFESYCGGLPAPEFSDNALRYKFSWSPRDALLTTLNSARYRKEGHILNVKEGGELMLATKKLTFLPGFNVEGYPNRDSTKYEESYGINDAATILRGTIRYRGFARATRCLQLVGFFDTKPHPFLHEQGPNVTWKQITCSLLGVQDKISHSDLKSKISDLTGVEVAGNILEDLGVLDNSGVIKRGSPLDTLSYFLSTKYSLKKEERDLIILRHDIGIMWPNFKREVHGISFVVYGNTNGRSAMSKTVGYTVGMATKMILDGVIQERGVILPFSPDIYRPLLAKLRAEGLNSTETIKYIR